MLQVVGIKLSPGAYLAGGRRTMERFLPWCLIQRCRMNELQRPRVSSPKGTRNQGKAAKGCQVLSKLPEVLGFPSCMQCCQTVPRARSPSFWASGSLSPHLQGWTNAYSFAQIYLWAFKTFFLSPSKDKDKAWIDAFQWHLIKWN